MSHVLPGGSSLLAGSCKRAGCRAQQQQQQPPRSPIRAPKADATFGGASHRKKARDVAANVAMKWAEPEEGTEVATGSFNALSGISVSSHFDSGNVDVVDLSDPADIRLRIHPDPYTEREGKEHLQWFYYRVAGAKAQALRMRLVNAGSASYVDGWTGYQARASYDRKRWFMVPTSYDAEKGELVIQHTPQRDAVYYAYFAPFTYEMHMALIASLQDDDRVCMKVLGQSHDGHDVEVLRVGTPCEGKRVVWVTARQHSGETMGEFFVQGLLRRLLDRDEALSRKVLQEAVFHVVPCMNPDGVWRGHLVTNAEGFNLNREWGSADPSSVPEVAAVLARMQQTGVDMFLDIHGDEVVGHNFLHGNEGIPSWDDRLQGLQDRFQTAFHRMDPTFCTEDSFGVDAPGTANMGIAARQVGERFNCLAFTVEMPFKDSEEFPDEELGWSPSRSQHFGASIINAIAEVLPHLR